jgi:hypothetical protein
MIRNRILIREKTDRASDKSKEILEQFQITRKKHGGKAQ